MKRPIMTLTLVLAVIICISAQTTNSIVSSDYVGIGLDNPAYRLHLFENSSNHMYLNFSNLTTGNNTGDGVLVGIDLNEDFRIHSYEDNDLRFYINNQFRMILKNDGKLGLNISDPVEGLHLHGKNMLITDNSSNDALRLQANGDGNAGQLSLYDTDGTPTLVLKGAESTSEGAEINLMNADGLDMIEMKSEGFGNAGHMRLYDTDGTETLILKGAESTTEGAEINLMNANGLDMIELKGEGYGNAGHIQLHDYSGDPTLILKGAESVSQGAEIILKDASGEEKIQLDGDDNDSNGGYISLTDSDSTRTIILKGAETTGDGAVILLKNGNNEPTIELDANHGGTDGAGRVITDELQIMGGADLSEYFNIDNATGTKNLPGMVVSISSDGSGSLRLSTKSYDKTVAGVISGANGVRTGLMMGQESSIAHGDTPVVLAGRAYVWADASFGAIQPGDLLTTSNTPGHVMKVRYYRKAQGAILGKAMTELEEGRGHVLVLVNLH